MLSFSLCQGNKSLIVHIGVNYNVEMPGFTYMLRPRKVTRCQEN